MTEQEFWNILMIEFMQYSLLRFSGQCVHAIHQAMNGADFVIFSNAGGVPFDCWLISYDKFVAAIPDQPVYAYRLNGEFHALARPIYDEDTGWLYWERI